MKQLKALFKRRPVFCGLLAAAVLLTAFSGVQTSRAALTVASNNFTAQLATDNNIHAALLENGTAAANSADEANKTPLLSGLLASGESFHPGQNYNETLTVQNTGSIDEYVRVVLYRYWTDSAADAAEKNRLTGLDPELIQLGFESEEGDALLPLGEGGVWIKDSAASSKERTVLYYSAPLAAGDTTAPLMDTLRINGKLIDMVTVTTTTNQENGKTYTTITASYPYENMSFVLEAEVDCVQTHNASAAIQSAWGVKVSIDETTGTLSLPGQ